MLRFALIAAFLLAPSSLSRDGLAAEKPRSWVPGERLEYTVTLGLLPTAALVSLETMAAIPEGDAARLRLRADVRPGPLMEAIYPFSYRFLSTVTLPGLLPEEGSRQIEEGGEREFLALTFDHAAGEVRQATRAGDEPDRVDRIEVDTRDMLSAVYLLRTVDPQDGIRFSIFENRRLYQVRLHPRESGTVEVPAGTFTARRYRLEAQSASGQRPVREIEVWISDDARSVPLRLQASTALGLLVAELTEFASDSRSKKPD